jgi:MoaA/NifB/PqqE/SkfB family radical SAM enzyme
MEQSYGFQGRLKAEFPSQVVVDAAEVCNLACIHCPHPEFKKSSHYSGAFLEPALNAKMVDEVAEHGCGHTLYIRYTSNGEPLVHPGIYDMLDYAVRRSGAFVTLTTNGTTMNEKRIRKLLESGLDLIDVSIDALSEDAYAAIRVNGELAVTRENVRSLIRMKRETGARTKIAVSFVEQELNRGEAESFERFWRAEGADRVVIRRLHSAAGGVAVIAHMMKREQGAAPRYPCLYPWERILLNPKGALAFCPQDWTHGSAIADYRHTTIRETWTGEFYRRLRQAHLDDDFRRHPFCGQCPDWRQTRWPWQGRSYADMVEELALRP